MHCTSRQYATRECLSSLLCPVSSITAPSMVMKLSSTLLYRAIIRFCYTWHHHNLPITHPSVKMSSNAGKLAIAVARGDGIGPEIMHACLKVFSAARVPLDYNFVEMGKDVYLAGNSDGMTPEAKAIVEKYGVLFKGT